VAVVGSRGLGDECYDIVTRFVPVGCSEIISGGAPGVDMLAERYAKEENLRMTVLRPDYRLFDRTAPLVRNGEIVRRADYVLILWDGVSRGTLNVIMTCLKTNKPYRLLLVKNGKAEE
jgi:hypothetical protein